jgi:hypothetical protein
MSRKNVAAGFQYGATALIAQLLQMGAQFTAANFGQS